MPKDQLEFVLMMTEAERHAQAITAAVIKYVDARLDLMNSQHKQNIQAAHQDLVRALEAAFKK